MEYHSGSADTLEYYVIRTVSLSGPAHRLYLGMRWLERERAGLCKRVHVGYADIVKVVRINVKSLKPSLLELQEKGLIELAIGSPIKAQKKETEFRRKTLDEIKLLSIQGESDAERLVKALSERSFSFQEKIIKPMWTVAITGRVCTSKPNIQSLKGKDSVRVAGLKSGLKQGEVLVHADIKAAEPTVIKHLLGIPQERDFYQEYATATGYTRETAKKPVNSLAYCKNSRACFNHWPQPAQVVLGDYLQKLSEYKARLYADFRKGRRSITTVTGRKIVALMGARIHRGQVMNWRVQGTIADIINPACLRIMKFARVVIPVHDAIYAIVPANEAGEVALAITNRAREIGLTVTVKTEVYHG